MDVGSAFSAVFNTGSVEEVFMDFKARRAALVKALTTDVHEFSHRCDPEKDNLCLYGFPNEHWEVNLPAEELPPVLPEPVIGINFSRDAMKEKDWLFLVACYSDSWLLSVAFYFGTRFKFDKNDRKRLHNMINELPTLCEVMNGESTPPSTNPSCSRTISNSRMCENMLRSQAKSPKIIPKEEEEEYEDEDDEDESEDEVDEHGEALCGTCGENDGKDEFWIGCDSCGRWFHGKCVKITPARAEHIKHYKCPSCSNKRGRTQ